MSKKREKETKEGVFPAEEGAGASEKSRRIAVGATVAGVLVFVFLLIVLIIQLVQIGVKNSERRELDRLIEEQKQTLDEEQKDLDGYRSGFDLFWKALDYGYKYQS